MSISAYDAATPDALDHVPLIVIVVVVVRLILGLSRQGLEGPGSAGVDLHAEPFPHVAVEKPDGGQKYTNIIRMY